MKHDNNFDLLRLLAALVVVGYHTAELTRIDSLQILAELGSRAALEVFFVISGFLVVQSAERSTSLGEYASKRVRRILPAYVAVVLLCVLGGAIVSSLAWRQYWSVTTLKYAISNLMFMNFLQPDLPGVFESNPWRSVNGSLWTIKVEVMFYAVVPLLVRAVRRFGSNRVGIVVYLLSALWFGVFTWLATRTGRTGYAEVAKQMPGQLMYFMAGAWLFYRRDWLVRNGPLVGILGALSMLAVNVWNLPFVAPIAVASLTVVFALVVPPLVRATRFGDLSYGLYIVHFPLLQTLIHYGAFDQPLAGLGTFAVLLLLCALASWHFVEAPFLRRNRGGIAEQHADAPAPKLAA
jgi:peptidoglycan/LPS O-acetylase OafA/YrhL